jgi:hypothetical protein
MTATPTMENATLNESIKYSSIDSKYDAEIVSYIAEILRSGAVTIQGQETLIDGVSQGVVSNSVAVQAKLGSLLSEIESRSSKTTKICRTVLRKSCITVLVKWDILSRKK